MNGVDALLALGTYLVHSTVLLGGSWLLLRASRPGPAVRERVWRCAMLLPLATTTLQLARPERFEASPLRIEVEVPALAPAPSFASTDGFVAQPRGSSPAAVVPAPAPGGDETSAASSPADLAAVALTLVALLALVVPLVRLRMLLRRRAPVAAGPLVDAVREIRERAGIRRRVRVTVSERVGAPVAIGTLRPEICVPPRALELRPELARALAAHELAHHARFDPLWLQIAHLVSCGALLQPLSIPARRDLARCAELLADDLAVAWTEDGLGLARCLTEVAGWSRPAPPASVAVAMVPWRRGSALRERVERALDRPRERSVRWAGPAAVALALGLAFAAPGVARGQGAARAASALGDLRAELLGLRADLESLDDHPDPAIAARADALGARADRVTERIEAIERTLARPSIVQNEIHSRPLTRIDR